MQAPPATIVDPLAETTPSQADYTNLLSIGILLVVLLINGGARWKMAGLLLERDEGEFAYMGQLLLDGVPPYQEAGNLKWPGTYAAYAVGMAVFGETIEGIRLTLLVVNSISIVFVFLIGRHLAGGRAAAMSAASFAVISFSPRLLGVLAHATHFVVAFAMVGIFLLMIGLERDRRWWIPLAGIFFGLSALMKQPGLLLSAIGGVLILEAGWSRVHRFGPRLAIDLGLFAAGVATPIVATFVWLWLLGVFPEFWFWTFEYARAYGSHFTWREAIHNGLFRSYGCVVVHNQLLVLLALVGCSTPWWFDRVQSRKALLICLPLTSLAAVCPGWQFFNHYWLLFAPALALLSGVGVAAIIERPLFLNKSRRSAEDLGMFLGVVAILWPAYFSSKYVLDTNVDRLNRSFGVNPFRESYEIANYLREHSEPADRIAVLGSEPEIFFYADRRSALRILYMYPLMDRQPLARRMQDMVTEDIEAHRPRFLLLFNVPGDWGENKNGEMHIFQWLNRFQKQHYAIVGLVRYRVDGQSEYFWGREAAMSANPTGDEPNAILIFERKDLIDNRSGSTLESR